LHDDAVTSCLVYSVFNSDDIEYWLWKQSMLVERNIYIAVCMWHF